MKREKRLFKPIKLAILLTIAVVMSVGCSSIGSEPEEAEQTIKVLYYDEASFYSQYGTIFSALYPNINIEVISTSVIPYEEGKDMDKPVMELIANEKPDVLFLGTNQYKQLAGEGNLYDLDTLIAESKYDLTGIAPGVVDYIKSLSGGKLYGMAPSYYGKAVYYNKDLFTKHNIPFPEDRMSWESLIQLAERFPAHEGSEDRTYGLKAMYSKNLLSLGKEMGIAQGLSFVNGTSKQLTVNTDAWKTVFASALKAVQSKSLYWEEEQAPAMVSYEDYLLRDPFISGKVAMVIEGYPFINNIKRSQAAHKEKVVQNWDAVTAPVDPLNPDVRSNDSIFELFAINASTTNPEAAWKFVGYVTGDEYARANAKSAYTNPIRMKYINDNEGHNLQAFYAIKPVISLFDQEMSKMPKDFHRKLSDHMQPELKKAADGDQSVSDSLDTIQTSGQLLLE
ncbi:ABC transporter substrate-binding protein [Paenibacillus spongiae]|uniref:Extracellular solute-binding protein n=1 Tax=Paenibacillus spongiae TaxID=2909671 RepID=A0ABY5S1C5_9BACL|nr:extracellular solute-binding protein [Paenibacillus spongiae]UVI27454.1 extracellular solute-binding protein [Paenibacillus spongiae]